MRRVVVVGSGGAGKSTLAAELGRLTGLPVIHLDSEFWHAGWVPTPDDEWDAKVAELAQRDAWIMDGNFGRTMSARFTRADTAIFLDFATLTCLRRVLVRWIRHRGKTRPDMAPGCPETVDLEFIRWILGFRRRSRPHVLSMLAENRHLNAFILRNPRDVRRFLHDFEPDTSPGDLAI